MFEQVQYEQRAPIVVVATQGEADLLVATLQVHGLAGMCLLASAIPSLDWVEGVAVTVPAAEADDARALVRELGHAPLPPPAGG